MKLKLKLKQIVIDKTNLTLTKEKKQIKYGEVFEGEEARGYEILKATYKGKSVAELVKEEPKKETPAPTKKTTTKTK